MKISDLATPRVLTNVALHRLTLLLLRQRLLVQRVLHLTHEYQPDPFRNDKGAGTREGRACIDRFEAFSALFPSDKPLSVLDIGCNQGYFTFRMAERGGLCIGIDSDRNEVLYARAQAATHRVANTVFAEMTIDTESARGLPSVDITICLSIFHHWVRFFGEDNAKEIMRSVAERTRGYLVFETGQHDETDALWAHELAFMGADSKAWIRSFLTELGFSTIHEAGPFATTVSTVPRTLYVAVKDGG